LDIANGSKAVHPIGSPDRASAFSGSRQDISPFRLTISGRCPPPLPVVRHGEYSGNILACFSRKRRRWKRHTSAPNTEVKVARAVLRDTKIDRIENPVRPLVAKSFDFVPKRIGPTGEPFDVLPEDIARFHGIDDLKGAVKERILSKSAGKPGPAEGRTRKARRDDVNNISVKRNGSGINECSDIGKYRRRIEGSVQHARSEDTLAVVRDLDVAHDPDPE
jgi:hypothetical protein